MNDDWCTFEEYQSGTCSVEPAPEEEPFIHVEPVTYSEVPSNPVVVESDQPFAYYLILVVAAIIVLMVVTRLLWRTKKS